MGEETTNLPPGFRFFPSDEQLVVHFLYRKAAHLPPRPDIIPTVDSHHCDPWELTGQALQGGNQWYFFARSPQNRASATGYWKPTGVDEPVTSGDREVGAKRTLVFHVGEAPEGIETNWVMHEYQLLMEGVASSSSGGRRSNKKRGNPRTGSNRWVVCRVYEASCGGFHGVDGEELSCLDEVFLSLDDLDEVSFPN